MQKVVLAPDSYKGILSAKEVADVMAYQINKFYPFCEIVKAPIADGGVGSIDAFMSCKNGKKIFANVSDADMKMTKCHFFIYENTAVIETCQILALKDSTLSQSIMGSTYGVGQLILQATKMNVSKIILCLGESVAADCGCGMAVALGAKFFDADLNEFVPKIDTLKNISSMDLSLVNKNLRFVTIKAVCSQRLSLTGKNGVAAQLNKEGASADISNKVEEAFDAFNNFVMRQIGTDFCDIAGGGSSLGLGVGANIFLDALLTSGAESVLDLINFSGLIKDADVIFTGEGSLDANSLYGNVLSGVCKYAKKQGIPVVDIVGKIGQIDRERLRYLGVNSVFALNNDISLATASQTTQLCLLNTMAEILSLFQIKNTSRIGGGKF